MQVKNISEKNSFKALYIDKNVDIEHRQQLFRHKGKLAKITNKADLYIERVTVPIELGSDYAIGKNFLKWEIAPLGSNNKNKKSFLDIFKLSQKEKSPKVFIGYSETYNAQDIKRMVSVARRNAYNIDYVIEQGKALQ